jgi:hypothetical protein
MEETKATKATKPTEASEKKSYFQLNFNTYVTILILIVISISFIMSLIFPGTHKP